MKYRMAVLVSRACVVGILALTWHGIAYPTTVRERVVITEDMALWRCDAMGNGECGTLLQGSARERCESLRTELAEQCLMAADAYGLPGALCDRIKGLCVEVTA